MRPRISPGRLNTEVQPCACKRTRREVAHLPDSLACLYLPCIGEAEKENIIIHHILMRENMSTYYCGGLSNDEFIVEALRRALVHGDQDARSWVQQRLGEVVHGWLLRHPKREAACRLNSEEHYVTLAFEQFWQLAIAQQLEVSTLTAAAYYLCVSLNAIILNSLRTSSRPKEVPLLQPASPGKPLMKDRASSAEVWESLQCVLLNEREQRLAYLLFHCGLGPGEIVHCCSQEFSDVCEIYRLRRTIMERFLLIVDHLR